MVADLNVVDVTSLVSVLSTGQLFSESFWVNLMPVLNFLVAIVVYSILVWHFYRLIAKRDLFHLDSKRFKYEGVFRKAVDGIVYVLEYALLYPLFSFVFFIVYAAMLLLLGQNLTLDSIMVTSISLISAIRLAAYYNEDLARDLAKLFPFAMLAIFLLDPTFFSLSDILAKLSELPNFFVLGLQYIVFLVVLEWALRILYSVYAFFRALLSYRRPVAPEKLAAAEEKKPNPVESP